MILQKVKIKNKKNIGVHPVYDISVPGAHHYILDSGLVSHNSGFIYASSIVVAMRKLKLKEDEEGNKTSTINGIRAQCKIMKTRYAKPFEQIEVSIPYTTGMSPTSGLVELIESKSLLVKDGNGLRYDFLDGSSIKQYRKEWNKNVNGCLDKIMDDFCKRQNYEPTFDDIENTDIESKSNPQEENNNDVE